MTFLRIINGNLIYTMVFLIFLINVGRDPHYILPYAIISGITIALTFKFALKKYNEINVLLGGILLYAGFFANEMVTNLSPLWMILSLGVGSSLIFQTIFYKHKSSLLITLPVFFIFAIFAVTGVEYLASEDLYELILEIGIVLSFFALLLSDQKTWSRLVIALLIKIRHPIKIKGLSNVPEEGSFIMVSNHPTYFDFLLLEQSSPREIKLFEKHFEDDFTSPIKDLISFHSNFKKQSKRKALKDAEDSASGFLKKGMPILIFPEMSYTKKDIKMNDWSTEIERLLEENPGVKILPVVIKDIKKSYIIDYNDNDQPINMKAKKYFKPIEVEFGKPITIKSTSDLRDIKKIMQKMGKDRI